MDGFVIELNLLLPCFLGSQHCSCQHLACLPARHHDSILKEDALALPPFLSRYIIYSTVSMITVSIRYRGVEIFKLRIQTYLEKNIHTKIIFWGWGRKKTKIL